MNSKFAVLLDKAGVNLFKVKDQITRTLNNKSME